MPPVDTIPTSYCLRIEVEETLDGMNQPYYYFTERNVRPKKNKTCSRSKRARSRAQMTRFRAQSSLSLIALHILPGLRNVFSFTYQINYKGSFKMMHVLSFF